MMIKAYTPAGVLVIFYILIIRIDGFQARRRNKFYPTTFEVCQAGIHRAAATMYTNTTVDTNSRRRVMLQQIVTTAATVNLLATLPAEAADTDTTTANKNTVQVADDGSRIEIPLEYISALNAYVVHFYLFGERVGAIIDTGSPFLTCPSTCSTWSYKYKWGCYHPERTFDSGYSNTIEGFDNNQGKVVWRKAEFTFDEKLQPQQNLTFGVFGPDLLDGPGGLFFGLIRDTDRWIRPSFLSQTEYNSFCVDLRPTPTLTLSKQSLIKNDDYIPLTRDLNRRYKAPVVHYTAKAAGFMVNGLPLRLNEKTPTYVIFDTGLSGMAVSEELFDGRNLQARKRREKSLWGEVRVAFHTMAGLEVELTARNPITTPLGKDKPWTKFKGNLIVLGLAFLHGNAMVVDIDGDKLQLQN